VKTSNYKKFNLPDYTDVIDIADINSNFTEIDEILGTDLDVAYKHSVTNKGVAVSGFLKITTNSEGHVTIGERVSLDDITALGIPSNNTAAGTSLGMVKTGGDVVISNGIITVNDNSHAHTISDVTNLKAELDGKEAVGVAATKAAEAQAAAISESKSYTDSEIATLIGHTDAEYDTLKEILDLVNTNKDAFDLLEDAVGTKANASDLANYLKLSGGGMTGHIYLTGAKENSSTSSTSQLVFGTSSNQHVAISSNTKAIVINPNTSSTTNQIVLYLDKPSLFPSGITANITGSVTGNVKGNVTGNADTATKLKEARTITLSGDVSGSASFDGSSGITITTTSNSGGFVLQASAPTNTKVLWIKSSNGVMYYHNGTTWTPVVSSWGADS